MNSSLLFQMFLYYHAYYDVLYGCILIPTGVFKLMVGAPELMHILSFVFVLLYVVTEFFRLNFGYKGNINESFAELLAFIIFSTIFSLVFAIFPLQAKHLFPHEESMYWINIVFLSCEIVIGIGVMTRFSDT